MPSSRTLLQLRTDFQDWGGFQKSPVFTDPVVASYLNVGVSRVYDIMADAREDFFAVETTIPTVAATGKADLTGLTPPFYRLIRVDVDIGAGDLVRLRRFENIDRDFFVPHLKVESLRVIYVPEAPRLSVDADTFTYCGVRQAEELVLHIALRRAYLREERPLAALDSEIVLLTEEVTKAASKRDQQEPQTMSDLVGGHHSRFAYRLVGDDIQIVDCER